MSTLKVFMKEKSKKELLEELKLLQERLATSELQEIKNEKYVKKDEKNL